MNIYQKDDISLESQWRAIILFGKNTASYKFAFAKSLLELASNEKTFISLEELAIPFSKYIIEHIKKGKKQIISESSQFIEACNKSINNEINQDKFLSITVSQGFKYVLDSFQVVGREEIPDKFYHKTNLSGKKGITIDDNLLKLKDNFQFENLFSEVESRWSLVETAWDLNISSNLLQVKYDIDKGVFFTENKVMRRIDITSSRDALNGYQKGKCFFCFDDISVILGSKKLAHIDHFFPHSNKIYHTEADINGVWNLVLACSTCNSSKSASVPDLKYLERLHTRNEFFIISHHPLRETLISQTGVTELERKKFLQMNDKIAITNRIHRWNITLKGEPKF